MRLLQTLLLMSLLFPVTGAFAAGSPVIVDHRVGNWRLLCSQDACVVMLNAIRDAGGNTTMVKIDEASMQPESFGIVVTGDVSEEKGLTAQFVKTRVDSKNPACAGGPDKPKPMQCYHQELLPDKTFNALFSGCRDRKCVAEIPGQFTGDKGAPGRLDLLQEYENNDALLIMWNTRDGNLKSMMLDIDGFKQAYATAISVLSKK